MGRIRRSVPRSRLPLHRRPLADPQAFRRWVLVGLLAAFTATFTGRVMAEAEASRHRWGDTRTVLVVDQAVERGQPIAGRYTVARWPVALVPEHAVSHVDPRAIATGPLSVGSPLTDASVARPGVIGRRRVAVPVGQAPIPLEPGDVVDVWATTDPSLAGEHLTTRRLATSATVTSADHDSVVLAVRDDEVADVAEAAALSTITLVASS